MVVHVALLSNGHGASAFSEAPSPYLAALSLVDGLVAAAATSQLATSETHCDTTNVKLCKVPKSLGEPSAYTAALALVDSLVIAEESDPAATTRVARTVPCVSTRTPEAPLSTPSQVVVPAIGSNAPSMERQVPTSSGRTPVLTASPQRAQQDLQNATNFKSFKNLDSARAKLAASLAAHHKLSACEPGLHTYASIRAQSLVASSNKPSPGWKCAASKGHRRSFGVASTSPKKDRQASTAVAEATAGLKSTPLCSSESLRQGKESYPGKSAGKAQQRAASTPSTPTSLNISRITSPQPDVGDGSPRCSIPSLPCASLDFDSPAAAAASAGLAEWPMRQRAGVNRPTTRQQQKQQQQQKLQKQQQQQQQQQTQRKQSTPPPRQRRIQGGKDELATGEASCNWEAKERELEQTLKAQQEELAHLRAQVAAAEAFSVDPTARPSKPPEKRSTEVQTDASEELRSALSAAKASCHADVDCFRVMQKTLEVGGDEFLNAVTSSFEDPDVVGTFWANFLRFQTSCITRLSNENRALRMRIDFHGRIARAPAGCVAPTDLHELRCYVNEQKRVISELLNELPPGFPKLVSGSGGDRQSRELVEDALQRFCSMQPHADILQVMEQQGVDFGSDLLKALMGYDAIAVAEVLLLEAERLALDLADMDGTNHTGLSSPSADLCRAKAFCVRLEEERTALQGFSAEACWPKPV